MNGIGPLQNAMRLQALRKSGARTSSRIGIVTSYDPTNYAVVATLQPDGVQTGWLSFASAWVGNGWGMFCPPTPGQRIAVELIDGDFDAGFAEISFFDNDNRPLEVQSGEFWLVHKSGQFVKLTNDGKLSLSDGHGASVALNGNGTISSAGSWAHTGDFNASGTVTGQTDVIAAGHSGKGHTHNDPQGGVTGTPN